MITAAFAGRDDRPFLPSDLRADRILIRAMVAHAVAAAQRRPPEHFPAIAREAWSRDSGTLALLTRAATVPADTTSSGWASQLAGRAVAAFVSSLSPQSAAAQLIEAGVPVSMDGVSQVTVPWATINPAPAFVAEGGAIPVGQGVFSGAVVGPPSKLAIIECFSRELGERSVNAVEDVIGALMTEAAGRALDAAVFSTAAATTTRPTGILNNVTPIAAATGGGATAMLTDLDALITAIVAAGGGRSIMLFASPGRAVRLRGLAAGDLGVPIVGTPALASGTSVAVEAQGFASGFGSDPDISVSREAVLHFEDSAPQQIGVSGSPTSPTLSMFQSDSMAMRLILDCAWAMRAPGLVQVVNGVTW